MSQGNAPTRVAIVGASGIGKHHAKWWALEGAEVCAFVGTSAESVARTRDALNELFPFTGRGYTDLGALIEAEQPAIIDVCSPPRFHFEHVKQAIEAGCAVLCEKPFVYDPNLPHEVLLAQAEELVALAEARQRRLALCVQYIVGARVFKELWSQMRPRVPILHYHGHLEAPAKGRPPDPRRVWMDLAPHILGVIQYLMPEGEIDDDTLQASFNGYEAVASFDVADPSGARLTCNLVARNTVAPPKNVRHFKFNGYEFAVEGHTEPDGVYGARIVTADGAHVHLDMMHLLIREFLAGRDAADAATAFVNLQWLLHILDKARIV